MTDDQNKTPAKKQNFLSRWLEKLDRKLEEKSKKKGGCCCKGKNDSCSPAQ